jgi:transposase-like protein
MKEVFPRKGNLILTPEQEKIHELYKRLKNADLERYILKKAIVIFSKSGLRFIFSLKASSNYSRFKKCSKF